MLYQFLITLRTIIEANNQVQKSKGISLINM